MASSERRSQFSFAAHSLYLSDIDASTQPCPLLSSSSSSSSSLSSALSISKTNILPDIISSKQKDKVTHVLPFPLEHSYEYHTNKRIKQLYERMDDIQITSFIKFINYHLSCQNKAKFVEDLSQDLSNGHILLDLIEIFSSTKLKREHGRTRFHSLTNVQYVLDYLKLHMQHINISPHEIVSGNRKQILALLWIIMKIFDFPSFRITTNKHLFTENTLLSFGQDRSLLLKWINNLLNQIFNTTTNYIKDFYIHTWNDCLYLSLIMKYLCPLSLKYGTLEYFDSMKKIEQEKEERLEFYINLSNYCFQTTTAIDYADQTEKKQLINKEEDYLILDENKSQQKPNDSFNSKHINRQEDLEVSSIDELNEQTTGTENLSEVLSAITDECQSGLRSRKTKKKRSIILTDKFSSSIIPTAVSNGHVFLKILEHLRDPKLSIYKYLFILLYKTTTNTILQQSKIHHITRSITQKEKGEKTNKSSSKFESGSEEVYTTPSSRIHDCLRQDNDEESTTICTLRNQNNSAIPLQQQAMGDHHHHHHHRLEFYRFVLESYCLRYLHVIPNDIEWFAIFSALINEFYENSRKYLVSNEFIFKNQKDAIDYSLYAINTLIHHQVNSKNSIDLKHDLILTDTISKAIGFVWEQNLSTDYSINDTLDRITPIQSRSIEYLFEVLSTVQSTTKTTFSPAIFCLFPRIQLDAIDLIIKNMYSDDRLTGERLARIIKSLIELIDAPVEYSQYISYETWIAGFCMTLISFNHHDYVLKIIDETTSLLIDDLFSSRTVDNACQILFWFVRYDKRLGTFRLILDHLPKLFETLQNNSNEDLKMKLIELCHMGIVLHPEYDISNEMILKQIIYSVPQPDLNVLLNHKNVHARLHSLTIENDRKIKNRVGIINLGNTCYVNSILQALYQCDLFRKYILEQEFSNQIVLRELQIVFAQLNLSKRPYINAINLVKIARPTWFTMNEQQDCAEFLGYLLDTIKDEEKNLSSNEIQHLFTIRTCQINRCQRCSIESYQEESNNYLFLPIPTSDSSHENFNSNHSITPISVMKNGLKFYAASNENALPMVSYDKTSKSLNLQTVFDCYFQKEELKDENQYRCEHCRSLQNAERLTILQTAPKYLILSLNRFEYDRQSNVFRKVFTKLNYPRLLNVHVYPSGNVSILTKYCLILLIIHTGYTLHGGHYYVYARDMKSFTIECVEQNGEWFLLNDDLVTSSSYEAMMDNCAQYTSATPYVLFYQRIDSQQTEDSRQIHIRQSLIEQISEDNINYERELDK
ncbi:hypothetical protein I4U23_025174 [Adineta vaga]|nr:hypothetical protein I4U23_025174 [Adineta vaga]